MKIGFLFPGQGAQSVGMGKDLYEQYEEARKVYDEVQKITGIDVKTLSFEGPEETLNETKNTQLAILTESLAILEVLKKYNIKPELSAGLSLGEYTALINSGIFSFEDGVNLVKRRGEIMQEFIPEGNWKMAAILGMADKDVETVCSKVTEGFVTPANYNTIGQIVISGEEKAIEEAEKIAKEMGAKKVSILKTAGPFHTEKLSECSKELRKELEKTNINLENIDNGNLNNDNAVNESSNNISEKTNKISVVKNIDGKIYDKTDDVVDVLSKHIMNPVRFTKVLQTMYDNGIDTFIEIGPGKTLAGFVKRMKFEKEIKILNINNCSSLEEAIKEVTINE
jgi:[acyl-carrier-protein] S-malonyltransferase